MLVYPITSVNNRINNQVFQGKNIDLERFFSSQKFQDEINRIKTNKDAKNVFLGLSVLAGSILAEMTHLAEKTPDIKNFADKILNHLGLKDNDKLQEEMSELFSSVLDNNEAEQYEYSRMLEENPRRIDYLKTLSDYPNLHKKYEEMLSRATKEPDDAKNKLTMETLEVAFELMTKNDRLQYYESYFETLDKDFSDKLDDLAATIINAYRNNIEPLSYLHAINSKRISPDEVTKWANAKNLEYYEFLRCKFMDSDMLTRISNLKEHDNNFRITFMKSSNNYKIPLYKYKLDFKEGMTLEEKLKTVTAVHTAIYGPISLNEELDIAGQYMNTDIRTELVDNLLKDRRVDSVFSFVKYINPDALKEFDLTSDDVKFLTKDDERYKKIKDICSNEIVNLDPENPKLFDIYEVMQNKEIFGSLFTTTHSKLRFITRFVLKNNPTIQNLPFRCNYKVSTLRKELDTNLKNFNILCFSSSKGLAPQFYNYDSKLGQYIKITLNASGNIHTIYEDNTKELKKKENNTTE